MYSVFPLLARADKVPEVQCLHGLITEYHIAYTAIHAFNKSGRHLEFSMNVVIRGKIIHVTKMATKNESSVDVDFAVCSYKNEVFTLF